ncbi:family 43 glycosylhydrolase [Maribellus maritimus]|uniref:family 43 glycosylhydrolase n=1 Tax=Maribellus maritimus TaxID=2870838 RepID=UPI001EE9F3DE|nr:family 43 glycosylhydrolase [Maribellus maritimus]MCG6187346.1 family 43 glycosylhydrolase [Maribellus maritimus]
MKKSFYVIYILFICLILFFLLFGFKSISKNKLIRGNGKQTVLKDSIYFKYEKISGIGYTEGISRRDPSDIIKVGDLYYIWYTKITANSCLYPSGYCGTIWYATSPDGYSWIEKGEALSVGENSEFDSHAVFTPNILKYKDKYYLYYTGVKPTPENPFNEFENNSDTDITAIGVAVSDSPDGPFVRINREPILMFSNITMDFDSYRVDDASLLVRDKKIWLYYKGRSRIYGKEGPKFTKMGVALSNHPEGPFYKQKKPLLDGSHEVLIWNQDGGIAALASISSSIQFAPNGFNFSSAQNNLKQIPQAPGLYRPSLTEHFIDTIPGWGISHMMEKNDIYLIRFNIVSNNETN